MRKCLMILFIASAFGCLAAAGIGLGGNAGIDFGAHGNLVTESMNGSSWNANIVWDSNLMQNDRRNFRVKFCSGRRTSNYGGESNIFENYIVERVTLDMLSLETTFGYHVTHGEHYRFWSGFNIGAETGYVSDTAWLRESDWVHTKRYNYKIREYGVSLGMSLGWNIPVSPSWVTSLEFILKGTIAISEGKFKSVDDPEESGDIRSRRENRIALLVNLIPFYKFME